jgi:PatG C-terminal
MEPLESGPSIVQGAQAEEGTCSSLATRPSVLSAQSALGSCPTCSGLASNSGAQQTYVYALGSINIRFPDISLEKEFAQVIARTDTKGLTDRQALLKALTPAENRYLARQVCWVMTIENLDTYILLPRDPGDFAQLIEAFRSNPNPTDIDIVIGIKGPIAPPEMCNGLQAPIVAFDQIYSFDRATLIQGIPRPPKTPTKEFTAAAEELLDRIQQMADNSGSTDEYRAANYLAVRYPAIYAATADAHARNSSLESVHVIPSRLSGIRKVVDVIFSFNNRNTDVTEKYFVRVDVTDEFPFLITKLSPYYDRL